MSEPDRRIVQLRDEYEVRFRYDETGSAPEDPHLENVLPLSGNGTWISVEDALKAWGGNS